MCKSACRICRGLPQNLQFHSDLCKKSVMGQLWLQDKCKQLLLSRLVRTSLAFRYETYDKFFSSSILKVLTENCTSFLKICFQTTAFLDLSSSEGN